MNITDGVFIACAMLGAMVVGSFAWATIEVFYEILLEKLDRRYARSVQLDRDKYNRF